MNPRRTHAHRHVPTAVAHRVLAFAGARAVEKHYDPELALARHAHPCAMLVLALDGRFDETCGGATIVRELKAAGYRYVTLDLQGYRTGSLNEGLLLRPA